MEKRRYRDGVDLSVIGFGGMVLVGMEQRDCDAIVAESVEAGVNYFDVAPSYGDGEAEVKLGRAIAPFRDHVFLASKTFARDAAGALRELDKSLKALRIECLDLYQFHAMFKVSEVERVFARGGAAEAVTRAQEQGRVKFVGFSAHSVEAALAMMDRMTFDSVLFPVNFVLYGRGGFWPQVLERARQVDVARLAVKAMALSPWSHNEARGYPNCWYRPVLDPQLARQAFRFALSEDVTAMLPPGDPRLYRMALWFAREFTPMSAAERTELLASASGVEPLFRIRSRAVSR
jgi:aryl-alcohol dehydrogenase-like predicted oxidoreductase